MKNETRLMNLLFTAWKVDKQPTGVLCGCDVDKFLSEFSCCATYGTKIDNSNMDIFETDFGTVKIIHDNRLNDKEFVLTYD